MTQLPAIQKLAEFTRQIRDPARDIEVSARTQQTIVQPDHHLTVVSANLWHDWPRHRHLPERLESLAHLIEERGAQVVLLQEAFRTPELSASEWLAERLGMAHAYIRANGAEGAIGFEEGPAILTNLRVHAHQALNLGSKAASLVSRMALAAQIEIGCCKLWVVSAHLGFLRNSNRRQMAQLRSWVEELSGAGPAIVGGDFNASESTDSIQLAREDWQDTFRALHPYADGHTHLLRWPGGLPLRRQRLDYLFLKAGLHNWSVLDARHLTTQPRPHSDHKVVLASISHSTFS